MCIRDRPDPALAFQEEGLRPDLGPCRVRCGHGHGDQPVATRLAGARVQEVVDAPDPAWTEVWSKALFLEGQRGIGPRARSLGLAAWWMRTDGTLEMTPAARERTVWLATDGEAAGR